MDHSIDHPPGPPEACGPSEAGRTSTWARLRRFLYELYYGDTRRGAVFRVTWVIFDLLIIAFFVLAPVLREGKDHLVFYIMDYAVVAFMAGDLAARAIAWGNLRTWIREPIVWVDLFVLATMLFPMWLFNFGFLRVLRLWTLAHSDTLWRTIGRKWDDTRVEDVVRASSTLLTFVFIMTGLVYTTFAGNHPGIGGYLDALYFTITSLTTTGYGDITLTGPWGRVLSIITMVVGITLFVRLAQAVFRPNKVRFRCPTCALMRHDPDAVCCKACGTVLDLPDEGE